MNSFRAALWDMDGVLVDTSGHHFQAWSQTVRERGVQLEYPDFGQHLG